ncbi:hypothetical protein SULYE_0366 [Sulfurihydrogenibium yellowstonense SS-5]|uniref:Uncharacterized protein n=1 Tax=Sulfurihydrogenibium yellowstonense SS-5 TaxID=432331 RepID=C4FII1_9AQUI|nr:hypothetical protein SULYE_0366 [Sulfurihydrogenibium yellowstonense SS-5]
MLWYNIEKPHHSLNKKSPLQYFCDIINSNKSEFSQTGMTYTISKVQLNRNHINFLLLISHCLTLTFHFLTFSPIY